jgi:hypothetical protein
MTSEHRLELELPEPLRTLIRYCETFCVVGCCGLEAFDRDVKHMLPWLREHQEQFFIVLDQLSGSFRSVVDHHGSVVSHREFNAIWEDSAECLQFLGEWRDTILRAAELVYGDVPTIDPAWRTADVLLLARGIYEERAFDRMPILADALQDAGCDNEDILAHCRDANTPLARGCWVVDLVLDKG